MHPDTMHPDTMQSHETDAHHADFDPLGLVPPGRLGDLLSRARSDRGMTLEELASSTNGRISLAGLAAIERGVAPLNDDALRLISDAYELDTTSLIPTRSQLVLDLNAGYLAVDDRRSDLPRRSPRREDVLVRYLSMVYSMRGLEPGTRVTLRIEDLDVLGAALHEGTSSLATDLEALMAHPGDLVRRRLRFLDRRILFPAAGVLVACLAAGSLLLLDRSDPSPAPAPTTSSIVVVAPGGPVDIGTPMTQQRSASDDGEARIIDPLVIERSTGDVDAPVISSTTVTDENR